MILTDHSSQDLNLVPFTSLANKFAYSDGKVSHQHGVAVLGDPHKVVFDLIDRMAAVSVVHPRIIELKLTG